MKIYKLFTVLILILSLVACDKKDNDNACSEALEFDRKEMVSQLTTQYITPSYNLYLEKTQKLEKSASTFVQNPSIELLEQIRTSWFEVATAWQNIAFLEFGPAENIGLRSQTNIYPVDTSEINANILNGNANIALPANFNSKGLQAIEYMLYNPSKTDEELTHYYSSNNNAGNYLVLLIQEINNNAKLMTAEWQATGEKFINSTANNSQGSAVSSIVNALSSHYETYVRKGKVGLPVGIFNGFSQTPLPGHAEAFYSDQSFSLLTAQMEAIKNFINGQGNTSSTEGLGLTNYIDFVQAKKGEINLSTAINTQIEQILSNIKLISAEPLSDAVNNQPDACYALYVSMQKLVPLIKVDLTSALGVLITYQDNDGD